LLERHTSVTHLLIPDYSGGDANAMRTHSEGNATNTLQAMLGKRTKRERFEHEACSALISHLISDSTPGASGSRQPQRGNRAPIVARTSAKLIGVGGFESRQPYAQDRAPSHLFTRAVQKNSFSFQQLL